MVQYAIAAGRISINAENLIDVEAADRDWDERTNIAMQRQPVLATTGGGSQSEPAKKRATEAVPGITYMDARALREVYDAQRRALDLAVRRGELMPVDEIEAEAFRLFRGLRDAVFQVPTRVAASVAAEKDEATVRETLERELNAIFAHFADQVGVKVKAA